MRRRINFFDLNELLSSFLSEEPIKNINKETKSGEDENGEWSSETYTSPDGTWKSTVVYRTSYGFGNGPFESNKSNKSSNLKNLKVQLEDAIEKQDFELAVELRDKIKSLEENKGKIEELELKLKESIEKQDFEKSIEIRDEIKKLKS